MSEPLHNPRYSPNLTSSEIKLPERTVNIEVGKKYKTRNGSMFLIVFDKRKSIYSSYLQPFIGFDIYEPHRVFDFTESGKYRFDNIASDNDLVSEYREPRKLEATVYWYEDAEGKAVAALYMRNSYQYAGTLLAIEHVTTTEGKGLSQ